MDLPAEVEFEIKRLETLENELNERAARLWPRSAEALNAFARCLHERGRDQEALKVAHEALAVLGEGDNFAQTAAVYLTLVWCLREMRRYREAIASRRFPARRRGSTSRSSDAPSSPAATARSRRARPRRRC